MRRLAITLGALLAAAPATAHAVGTTAHAAEAPAEARVTANEVAIGNGLFERRWDRGSFRTLALTDLRDGGRRWGGARRDFSLFLGDAEVGSGAFRVSAAHVERLERGGVRVTMSLVPRLPGLAAGLTATRVAEAYPGIAGVRTRTTLHPRMPLTLTGATLDEAAVGPAAPTSHSFRAGADWREPDWAGPQLSLGDPHAGTWRETRSPGWRQPLEAPAQWLELRDGERSLFMVAERPDLPSTRAEYGGGVARLAIRHPRDGVLLGPFEEDAHVEGPSPLAGRSRVLTPGVPLQLEPAFTGFGKGELDAEWQHHRYLLERRMPPYPRAVSFNSNGSDDNRISTGAKDDMDMATVREVAPVARRLGVETFILDDGWQAASGDWEPDSPQHPEPRGRYAPRFPDDDFTAVREAIAPMRLGLWMSPMAFNPASRAYRDHPDWACLPLGDALALYNTLEPDEGSNEAGLGLWSPRAIPHVESRIREAITEWGVEYFKFDFLVWLDCAGDGDVYTYREAFVAMLDRLIRDHPRVTFQIDETNDYRLFPFESLARGPSWFQNGTPPPERLLHNIWNLSPWVPSFSLGQHFLGGRAWEEQPVDTLMAAALLSHMTFFSDLRELPEQVVDRAAPWIAFYKERRGLLDGLVIPLLHDPLGRGWTALQAWDPERGEGALLAFRQGSAQETRTIALKAVPPGRTFELRSAPGGELVGLASSAELRAGLPVRIPQSEGAAVLTVQARG
jgi:hypothetical protein